MPSGHNRLVALFGRPFCLHDLALQNTGSTGCEGAGLKGYRLDVAANQASSIVVFSDADGVLVDPQQPSFDTAASILARLAADEVAVVLCSGKTRAELESVQQKLGIRHPFICEHGGAVLIPKGYFGFDVPNASERAGCDAVEFGRAYADVVQALRRTADRLKIDVVAFSDMSIEDVARECRVPLLQARLAKLRDYQELFRIGEASETARTRLFKGLQAARLRCTPGVPFNSVGAPVDRTAGVTLLTALFRCAGGAVLTGGVTHTNGEDTLLPLVDYPIMMPDDDTGDSSIDVVDWAEAIVDAVQELKRRHHLHSAAVAPR